MRNSVVINKCGKHYVTMSILITMINKCFYTIISNHTLNILYEFILALDGNCICEIILKIDD